MSRPSEDEIEQNRRRRELRATIASNMLHALIVSGKAGKIESVDKNVRYAIAYADTLLSKLEESE